MKHKKLLIILGAVIFTVLILFIIRGINLNRKSKEEPSTDIETSVSVIETGKEPETTTSYDSNIGLGTDAEETKVTIPDETEVIVEDDTTQLESFDLTFKVYGRTVVPDKLLDGTSCLQYLNKLSSKDISNWGSDLTQSDLSSRKRVLVGTSQATDDICKGDLQSVGWLMNNLNNLSDSTCIKFTDLHVVGTIPSDKTILLCMYSWYSVFGMKETLVLFEDCSNSVSNIADGSTISFSIYKHNARVETIKGQKVVVVKYYN